MRSCTLAVGIAALALAAPARAAAPVSWSTPAAGFVPETFDEWGWGIGPNAFPSGNAWGQYSAYLMSTNDKGQRTWRIENYLPNQAIAGHAYAQGSTMYLFEGSQRALLVDTAQNTTDVPVVAGQPDLVTVVRQLLEHDNTGAAKPNPITNFVAANTHSHGDHTGKNAALAPHTIYYPDGDWPANAPANYVPIKEGGGPTTHGGGTAVGSLDLGNRTIEAIDVPEHTPGSTAYLDRENRMVATGDAIGSGFVYAQGGPLTQYASSAHHLQQVLTPYPDVAVMPAHVYQFGLWSRRLPPISGRPTDSQYVSDEVATADGILNGDVVGEPYRAVGRNAVWARVNSAQTVYALNTMYPGGIFGGNGDPTRYHAVAIPGGYRTDPFVDSLFPAIDNIKTGFYLIRDSANTSMYLIKGSTRALLVGTGRGTPGIVAFAKNLAGTLSLAVVVTSDDPDQVGGLAQFAGSAVYGPAGVPGVTAPVGSGDVIDLGVDSAGRPARIEVQSLTGHSQKGLTLIDVSDRVLLSGDALGEQFNGGGLILRDALGRFDTALKAWRTKTDGRYDVVYTAHNYQWYTSPAYVDQVQQAVTMGLNGSPTLPSVRPAGYQMIRSTGAADIVASIALAYAETNTPGTVGGSVGATLSLTLGSPASFGAFVPGKDATYTASTTANVVSTAGDAALSVADPGRLSNGSFTLAEPLQVTLSKASWAAPVSNDLVTIAFSQHIGANEPLRTGTYSKTLTFTLSTTTP
jgi:glyoxylase-like metal-dependent hydrolase (beta-lactamase superfamily II)